MDSAKELYTWIKTTFSLQNLITKANVVKTWFTQNQFIQKFLAGARGLYTWIKTTFSLQNLITKANVVKTWFDQNQFIQKFLTKAKELYNWIKTTFTLSNLTAKAKAVKTWLDQNQFLQKFLTKAKELYNWVKNTFTLSNLITKIKAVKTWIDQNPFINGLLTKIKGLYNWIKNTFSLSNAVKQFENLKKKVGEVIDKLTNIDLSLPEISLPDIPSFDLSSLNPFGGGDKTTELKVSVDSSDLIDIDFSDFQTNFSNSSDVVEDLETAISTLKKNTKKDFTSIQTSLNLKSASYVKRFEAIGISVEGLEEKIELWKDNLKIWFTDTSTEIDTMRTDWLEEFDTNITNSVNNLKSTVNTWKTDIAADFETAKADVLSLATDWGSKWAGMEEKVTNLVASIATFVDENEKLSVIIKEIKNLTALFTFDDGLTAALQSFTSFIDGITVPAGLTSVVDKFVALRDAIADIFANPLDKLFTLADRFNPFGGDDEDKAVRGINLVPATSASNFKTQAKMLSIMQKSNSHLRFMAESSWFTMSQELTDALIQMRNTMIQAQLDLSQILIRMADDAFNSFAPVANQTAGVVPATATIASDDQANVGGFVININNPQIANDLDIETVAVQVTQRIQEMNR